jgi:nicotinamide mononucleotide transporter
VDLWAQLISAALGLLSTYLLTKGDGRGWALGAGMSVLAAYVYLIRQIYGSFLIQIFFLSIQLTGLWKWKTGADPDLRKVARRMTLRQGVGLGLVWIGVGVLLGSVLQAKGGNLPYLDGLGVTGNVLAQLTMIASKPECWIVYMLTNLCYIALSYRADIHAYTVLYCVYMFVAYQGWRQWTRKLEQVAEA